MTREELRGIIKGIGDEEIKSILDINSSDIGKAKKEMEKTIAENETLKAEKKTLEEKIAELDDAVKNGEDAKRELEELQKTIKEKEDAEKARKEDAELTAKIEESFGDKEFTSDYVRGGIIRDMKKEILKPENEGRAYKDIFEAFTRDKEGIFKNPNPPLDIAGLGEVETGVLTREEFKKMGYRAKNELYRTNKDLYNTLNKE